MHSVDIFIIGGGINGSGIARDAAGRGLSVMLAEQGDYASGASGRSDKLLHGGLEYLEKREFSLACGCLKERTTVANSAPHLCQKLPFILPVHNLSVRSPKKLRLMMKFYDFLAGALRNRKRKTQKIRRRHWRQIQALKTQSVQAVFKYFDYQVNDVRLVMENIIDARQLGADVGNYREVLSIHKREDNCGFEIQVRDQRGIWRVHARHVVNAAGPWVNRVNDLFDGDLQREEISLVRESHIVLAMPEPAIEEAFALRNKDGQTVYVTPWHNGKMLLVGKVSTEVDHAAHENEDVSTYDVNYLLASFNRYLSYGSRSARVSDIVWKFSGVRVQVVDDEKHVSKINQDVRVTHSSWTDGSQFVCVYGGRLTTYRALADKIVTDLSPLAENIRLPWTESAILPGGSGFLEVQKNMQQIVEKRTRGVYIRESILKRWAATYGIRSREICDLLRHNVHLQHEFVPGVCEVELLFSVRKEDARTGEDFLYRRTQLHLDLSEEEQQKVNDWFTQYHETFSTVAAE